MLCRLGRESEKAFISTTLGFALFGLALWLGNYAAALALPVVLASLVVRIHVEERHLRDTLPGYAEYMRRVRYRLVPGVW